MTALVAIKCTDGVVVGADGSATFGPHPGMRTIEQTYAQKIEILHDRIIIAGTGFVGHCQRFTAVVDKAWTTNQFAGKSAIECGKILSAHGIKDFRETVNGQLEYAAYVAMPASRKDMLCELLGAGGFQPELKLANGLWFASAGSGELITDPFLALLKEAFWSDGAPTLQGGIFMAVWALVHACEVNPGGIKEPIQIAILEKVGDDFRARFLTDAELEEHRDMVDAAMSHLGKFKDVLLGRAEVPTPPAAPVQT